MVLVVLRARRGMTPETSWLLALAAVDVHMIVQHAGSEAGDVTRLVVSNASLLAPGV